MDPGVFVTRCTYAVIHVRMGERILPVYKRIKRRTFAPVIYILDGSFSLFCYMCDATHPRIYTGASRWN
jgi:hypothetical protein